METKTGCEKCYLTRLINELWNEKIKNESIVFVDEKSGIIKFVEYNLLLEN